MSPETRIPESQAPQFLLGVPCPDENCDGRLQTYEVLGEPIKVCCYQCGQEVDIETVKVVYENK